MLRISGGEPAIAFFQARNGLRRGNDWLIGMSWISTSRELICAKQADYDEARCKLCLSHAGDLNQRSPARSIRKSEANGGEHQ
jgi:hypothetical protein